MLTPEELENLAIKEWKSHRFLATDSHRIAKVAEAVQAAVLANLRHGCECNGCGGNMHKKVLLTNGALRLCKQCLDCFNAKNPQVAEFRQLLEQCEAALAERNKPASSAFWKRCDAAIAALHAAGIGEYKRKRITGPVEF